MSKNVDCLTKDAFQSGRRARERRRGIGKATNKRNQSISQQTRGANSSCNLANETIYEESESNLETGAKANCKNEEDAVSFIFYIHKLPTCLPFYDQVCSMPLKQLCYCKSNWILSAG